MHMCIPKLPKETALWKANIDLKLDLRSSTMMSTDFSVHSGQQVISGLHLKATADGLALETTATDAKYDMQYILDGKLVGTNAGNHKPVSIDWDEIWCDLNLPQGLPSEICDIWISYQQNAQGQSEWNLQLPRPVSLTDENGQPIQVNRLRLVEVKSGQANAAGQTFIDAVEIHAANLDSLTIRSEESSAQPEETAPTVPEPDGPGAGSPNQTFLPIVLK